MLLMSYPVSFRNKDFNLFSYQFRLCISEQLLNMTVCIVYYAIRSTITTASGKDSITFRICLSFTSLSIVLD